MVAEGSENWNQISFQTTCVLRQRELKNLDLRLNFNKRLLSGEIQMN